MNRGQGVYLFRTRKPWAPYGLPIIGRHNGYVGQTCDYELRRRQHVNGGGKYRVRRKDWADLEPTFRRILPLPRWLFDWAPWAVNALEFLCILALMPVYNVKLNKHNIRRIPLRRQRAQRYFRDNTSPQMRRFVNVSFTLVKWMIILVIGYLAWQVTR